ncbi:hypothetical protein Dimus_009956 [Dionaea muscipula]
MEMSDASSSEESDNEIEQKLITKANQEFLAMAMVLRDAQEPRSLNVAFSPLLLAVALRIISEGHNAMNWFTDSRSYLLATKVWSLMCTRRLLASDLWVSQRRLIAGPKNI